MVDPLDPKAFGVLQGPNPPLGLAALGDSDVGAPGRRRG